MAMWEFLGAKERERGMIKAGGSAMMTSQFSEEKATAATAFLLKQRGGRMSYLKLVKLLYLADREALYRWGSNITTDRYVSMDHGPVVSNIYNLMLTDERQARFWSQFITPPLGEYEISLRSDDIPDHELSRAEEKLLLEIFATYGTWNRWKLRDFTHTLPEWKDPKGSSLPIGVDEMLRAAGRSEAEIQEMTAEALAAEKADRILGTRR